MNERIWAILQCGDIKVVSILQLTFYLKSERVRKWKNTGSAIKVNSNKGTFFHSICGENFWTVFHRRNFPIHSVLNEIFHILLRKSQCNFWFGQFTIVFVLMVFSSPYWMHCRMAYVVLSLTLSFGIKDSTIISRMAKFAFSIRLKTRNCKHMETISQCAKFLWR